MWDALENLLRDNKESRAIQIKVEFCNLVQGDMTIKEYCAKLKTLADALGNVGQPVSDKTLVLTCLCGLHEDYSEIVTIAPLQTPFSTFLQTRSMLLFKEN